MDYHTRLEELRGESERENNAYIQTFQWLIGVAAAAGIFALMFLNRPGVPSLAVFGIVPAYFLLRRIKKIRRRNRKLSLLCAFYERGMAREKHAWMDHTDTGEEYADSDHPYVPDLDLFGRGSMFQLLCIAGTGTGAMRWQDG